jgi:hypothetical protein
MLRTGLIAVLLLGLGSTAMASDRVRVFVGFDDYYGGVSYGFSYVGGGRDYRGWDRHRHDRRWHHRDWNDRRGYNWRHGRYYSAPPSYYYPYRAPYYGKRHGYSRGYYGDRHWHDRRSDGRYDGRHDGRRDGRRWHRH